MKYLETITMDMSKKKQVLEHLNQKKNCLDIGILGAENYVNNIIAQQDAKTTPQDTASL
jgi:hypothetical protein